MAISMLYYKMRLVPPKVWNLCPQIGYILKIFQERQTQTGRMKFYEQRLQQNILLRFPVEIRMLITCYPEII